jgi:hypothetical protein
LFEQIKNQGPIVELCAINISTKKLNAWLRPWEMIQISKELCWTN